MKTLPIVWQRLVSVGQTCLRYTGDEVERACAQLRRQLRPQGIEPVLETREIDENSFRDNPAESNRVWIAGRPMEAWLGASVGSSRNCAVCGDAGCRTVAVDGATYEVVLEALLVKAGLIAALTMIAGQLALPAPLDEGPHCGSRACRQLRTQAGRRRPLTYRAARGPLQGERRAGENPSDSSHSPPLLHHFLGHRPLPRSDYGKMPLF